MSPPIKIPPPRLIFQGYIPCENIEHGKQLFEELKCFIRSWDATAHVSGQFLQMLEPCCESTKNQSAKTDT